MDYEKKYKDALEWARKVMQGKVGFVLDEVLEKFPELEESKDERIRKEIIDFICWATDRGCITKEQREKSNSWLAWLEKQGEQKPNKVEPKFNVGDWVVNKLGDVWHIDSFDKKNYQVSNGKEYNYFPISKQNEMHLYTIEDAKNGDVLASNRSDIIIVRRVHKNQPFAYCGINNDEFMVSDSKEFWHEAYYHPATKEQREVLEKAMADAGYIFDFEKKELRKIEQKPIEWSEEDEKTLAKMMFAFKTMVLPSADECNKFIEFLKSIRDKGSLQSTWKPSEEQMDALRYVTNFDYGGHKATLVSLYEQLKKLREDSCESKNCTQNS